MNNFTIAALILFMSLSTNSLALGKAISKEDIESDLCEAYAQSVPTHCNAQETSIVNAWMGPIKATSGGWVNSRSGKFLSICADKDTEPFNKVVYRYGSVGNIELEEIATKNHKFKIFSRSTSPHTGDDLIYFTKGKYTYYVAIATGQGSGVSLKVFEKRNCFLIISPGILRMKISHWGLHK